MSIDTRALRYFVEAARLQSFTQAAGSLSVTQSTVNKMVRQLENEAGQSLLIRGGEQVRLTDMNRVAYARGQGTLGVVYRLTLEVAGLSSFGRGELTVGIPLMMSLLFSPVVSVFRQRYPNLVLNLAEHSDKTMEQRAASDELEVGATVLLGDSDPELATRQFAKYPIWAVGPRKAKWAKGRTVALTALHGEPLLLPAENSPPTRKLQQAFLEIRTESHIATWSGHWEFLVLIAAVGLGTIFLLQPLVVNLVSRDKLTVARPTAPNMGWVFAHLWLPGRYLSHAVHAWLVMRQEVPGA